MKFAQSWKNNKNKSHKIPERFVEKRKSCCNLNFKIGQICPLGLSSVKWMKVVWKRLSNTVWYLDTGAELFYCRFITIRNVLFYVYRVLLGVLYHYEAVGNPQACIRVAPSSSNSSLTICAREIFVWPLRGYSHITVAALIYMRCAKFTFRTSTIDQ